MAPSITSLPSSTARLISSHVVVISPMFVVKELLENAIDAKATFVEVLVSPDTISRIEVRDDGVGIHPDDYDALGRRGHTSKLRNIEELGSVFGKTLGFRGEALASVNTMADISITSKTSTEPVASILQIAPDEGGVQIQKPISAPSGTTVSVTNLFRSQPVRKQVAISDAKKTLDKIQELLRSYAMARPQLKLSFKVLQSSTQPWSYSPKPNATAMEAAVQLFGASVASSCIFKTFCIDNSAASEASPDCTLLRSTAKKFVLEAILASPYAKSEKIPKRRYFSVDGRPISSIRGVAKRLLNIYLEHLKWSVLPVGVSDYFIRLNICCPLETYDANIEPSKDDVLISNEHLVSDAFRNLCSSIYQPVAPTSQGTSFMEGNDKPATDPLEQDVLHSPREQRDLLGSPGCVPQLTQDSPNSPSSIQHDSPQRHTNRSCVSEILSYDQRPHRISSTNNFTPVNTVALSSNLSLNHDSSLTYAPPSPLTPEPPIMRHVLAPPGDLEMPRVRKNIERTRVSLPQRSMVPGGPYRSPMASPSGNMTREFGAPLTNAHRMTLHCRYRQQPPWTPPSSLEKDSHNDIPQADVFDPKGTDNLRQTRISFGSRPGRQKGRTQDNHPLTQVRSETLPGLQEEQSHLNGMQGIVSTAKKHLQYQLSQMENGRMTRVVHDERPKSGRHQSLSQRQPLGVLHANTIESGEAPREDREPIPTTLSIDDPRAYLLRRQKSMARGNDSTRPTKLRRVKSSLMPLENIPANDETHSLSWPITISTSALDEFAQYLRKYDEYVVYGTLVDGLDMSLVDGRAVESQLQKLLNEHKENVDNEITIDLQTTLKGKDVLDTDLV